MAMCTSGRRWALLVMALWCASTAWADVLIKDGDSVAFLGDSITDYGAGSESGYVRMVASGLKANGIGIKVIPAGVSGDKAQHMLARIDKDVIAKHPVWMTLSCGVNDRWFQDKTSTPEKFRGQVASILDKAKKAGVNVLLMTPTTIGNENAKVLEPYCRIIETFAATRDLPLADCHTAICAEMEARKITLDGRNKVTADGVHMSPIGNRVMARCVLQTFGLNEKQLEKAEAYWAKMPEACELKAVAGVPFQTYRKLEQLADARSRHVSDVYDEAFDIGLRELVATPRSGLADGEEADAHRSSRSASGSVAMEGAVLFVGDYFLTGVDARSQSGTIRFVREGMQRYRPDVPVSYEKKQMSMVDIASKMDTLLEKKPDYLVISSVTYSIVRLKVGPFKTAVDSIVKKARSAGVTLVFITGRESRQGVAKYNEVLHAAAGDKVRIVDAYAMMASELKRRRLSPDKSSSLCIGYSLLPPVNALAADGVLEALGFGRQEIAAVREDREKLADACEIPGAIKMTFERYDAIVDAAEKRGQDVRRCAQDAIRRGAMQLGNSR